MASMATLSGSLARSTSTRRLGLTMAGPDSMKTTAEFSPCRRYRFALWRRWDSGPQVLFAMLNPSTADETTNDPTIRRCIGFARAWGFGSLAVGNLFAFRT